MLEEMNSKIEKIIIKYLTKSVNTDDLDLLIEWIQKPKNEKVFKDYVQTHYAITFSMNNEPSKKALERLLTAIRNEKSIVFRLKYQPIIKYAAAAVIIGILTTSYFLKDTLFNNEIKTPIIVNTQIKPGTDKATLTLENGKSVALTKETKYQTQNAESNGEKIIYHKKTNETSKIAYNYLTVPRGGQFQITLSDSTQVWLNSESQLKYPVNFLKGKSREVELIYGEAYFEVSPSTKHQGATFQVLTKGQKVEVLGTEFNIKSYKDETNIYTTLVNGKVAVSFDDKKQNLVPNQQSNYNLLNNTFNIASIDVYNEISWKEGVFSFEDKSLKEIMKVLARWYDIEVEFKNKKIENERFVGNLSRNQNINEILSTIKNFGVITDYRIVNKKITIN